MANAFDQFDAPAAATTANPFDRFAPPKAADWKPDLSTAGRVLGLTARNAIQGAAALPGMIANIPGGIYNAGADLVQGYHAPSRDPNAPFRFSSMGQNVSDLLTKTGLPEPATMGERLGGDIQQGMSGAGAGLGIAQGLKALQGPVAAIGRTLGANPVKQVIGGATGGLAAGGAQEAGLPVPAQIAAGLVAGAAPFAGNMAAGLARGGQLTAAEQRATTAGYTIPPATMDQPSVLSKLLGAWSGKVKSQQAASVKNQALTNQIAAGSLGLPRDTLLDDNVFSNLRQKAGQAYEAVKQAVPVISTDAQFQKDIQSLDNLNSQVGTHFPGLVKNDAITSLVNELGSKADFPAPAGVEAVKILRANSTKNLQAIGDPEKHALGFAQRETANAVDDLLDRNVSASGSPDLVNQYRAARQLIAKSHDVESATNTATGEVNARRFGMLANKGKPLSGGLETIGNTANAFPKATQMPSKFGGAEPLSILDIMAAATPTIGGAMSGRGLEGAALGGAILSRPLARALTLSKAYQSALRAPQTPWAPGLIPGQTAIDSNIFRNNQ